MKEGKLKFEIEVTVVCLVCACCFCWLVFSPAWILVLEALDQH